MALLRLVGIGGTGAMLSPSAGHLRKGGPVQYIRILDRGTQSAVHDARRKAWAEHGAQLVDNMEALLKPADFDAVVICAGKNATDHAIITDVVRTLTEYGCGNEKIILHLSTVSVDFAEKAAAFCRVNGHIYVNYPLTGGAAGAANASMLILGAGLNSVFDYLHPMLSVIGQPRHCGNEIADGAKTKLIGHYLVFNGLMGIASAVALHAACFEDEVINDHQIEFFQFLNGGAGGTRQFDVALLKGLLGDWATGFKMDHAAPDCLYAAQLGDDMGLSSACLSPLLNMAVALGFAMKNEPGTRNATQSLVRYLHSDNACLLDDYIRQARYYSGVFTDFPEALRLASESLPTDVHLSVMLDVLEFKL